MLDILLKLIGAAKELGTVASICMYGETFATIDFVTGDGKKVSISVAKGEANNGD